MSGLSKKTGKINTKHESSGDNSATDRFSDHFSAIFEATSVGLWDWDLLTGKVIYSKEWENILGYNEGELPRHISSWENNVVPEDIAVAGKQISDYLSGKTEKYIAEFRMVTKDKRIIWAQDKGYISERDSLGKPVRFMGILQDITRLRAAEQQLKINKEQLDFFAGFFGLATWDWDIGSGKIEYSDKFYEMTGRTRGQGSESFDSWTKMIHPDDLSASQKLLDEYISGSTAEYSSETRIKHSNGGYIWTLDTGRIMEWDAGGKPKRILGGHLFIDNIKKTEQQLVAALEENEAISRQLRSRADDAENKVSELQMTRQALFEASPYINVLFDSTLKPIDCNPAAVTYFGGENKASILKNFKSILKKSIPPFQPTGLPSVGIEERFKQTIEDGYLDFETELNFGGIIRPCRAIFKRIDYSNDFTIAVYLIDLQPLKNAENELLHQDRMLRAINNIAAMLTTANIDNFDTVLHNAMEALGTSIDADRVFIGRNMYENDILKCRQIYSVSAAKESPARKEYHKNIKYEFFTGFEDNLKKGKSINAITRFLPPSEKKLFSDINVKSILMIPLSFEGNFWGFIGFSDSHCERNCTDPDEKIIQSGGILIASSILQNEATRNLIEARETALLSTKAKSDFLSRMSHELRTPMNAIIGMSTLAKKSGDEIKINYYIDKIATASSQMMEIINNILDMSKIEADKFEIVEAEFDFDKMINKVVSITKVKADEKNQSFEVIYQNSFTKHVVSDELRLSQVLTNLLGNAIKFTPENGKIILKIRYEDHENCSTLYAEVIDNGIGLFEEQIPRLFKSFEQADGSTTRRFGGTGLGLSICKRIVALMGGEISVESSPGKGAAFRFNVDFTWGTPLHPAADGEEVLPENFSDLKILVVDDSEDVRLYFSYILDGYSFKCDTASSGQEAIDLIAGNLSKGIAYDIIFLDWKMPGLSGSETAEKIKRIMDGNIVVVMISVADLSEIESHTLNLHIDKFLPKPVLPSVMYDTIVQLTKLQNLYDAQRHESKYDWKNRNILVAEDIEINREIIGSILEETNINIEYAADGRQAVDMFEINPGKYDLILMDIQMPELDGLAATREIRALGTEKARQIPILAMTANAFKEDIRACIDAGMDDHVAKPIDIDMLLKKMSHYLDF